MNEESKLGIIIACLIIAGMLIGIGYGIYEDVVQSELETCMEKCTTLTEDDSEKECQLSCIENIKDIKCVNQ